MPTHYTLNISFPLRLILLSVRICIPCSVSSVNREVVELYFRLNMADTERMRVSFHEKLHELLSRKNANSVFLTEDKYTNMVKHVNELKSGRRKKQSQDYQILKKYDVVISV